MTDPFVMHRRDLIARIALLLGATALPAEAFAALKKGASRFLTAPQFALLSAAVDTILPATDTPGALAAGVPARLDAMLRGWASPETRANITARCAELVRERIDLDPAGPAYEAKSQQLDAALSALWALGPHEMATI